MTEPYGPRRDATRNPGDDSPTEPTPDVFGRPAPPAPVRQDRQRRRFANSGGVIWGLVLLGIGLWYFLEVTLGIRLPAIEWGSLWPVILIVLGVVVILQGFGRRG